MEIWRDLTKVISIEQPETDMFRSEASTLERSNSNSFLIAIRNIYMIRRQNEFCWKTGAIGGKVGASFVDEHDNSPNEFCQGV
jgi:hypothetical protein